jgi:hypothetical protein
MMTTAILLSRRCSVHPFIHLVHPLIHQHPWLDSTILTLFLILSLTLIFYLNSNQITNTSSWFHMDQAAQVLQIVWYHHMKS